MQQSLAEMKTALRVLTALNEKQAPATEDVEELRSLAPPDARDLPLDELACEVIQAALKRRAAVRRASQP